MKWKSKLGQKSGLERAVNDTQAKVEQTHTSIHCRRPLDTELLSM